jgi:hypothetical protein
VAGRLDRGQGLLSTTATLWPRLLELFRSINEGNPPLKVATFNGGLFDPQRHPFLERHTVGDARLQRAIDMLARVDGEWVDYRDLAERHLGTIYEGLLEFRLAPVEPRDGWTVELLNHKGERKLSGSYYTPDYIVKYIVEQTVGPVLRRAVEGLASDDRKIDAVLAVNVLDPAMGSGHFPVEITEYIARFLVGLGVHPPAEAEASGEAELAYWKRRVAQSCVYGVDSNPLAVDLAKLSLWLSTVARDRPLSFLDHHLRVGNSLVGARLADLRPGGARPRPGRKEREQLAAGQLSMLEDDAFRHSMRVAVDSMSYIESSPAETVQQVKAQEGAYLQLREELTGKYERLANLVAATHFGVSVEPALWNTTAAYARDRGIVAPRQIREAVEAAGEVARGRRFFHWELEFPEVFFDKFGRPKRDAAGFDAVVANPPYVRQEDLGEYKRYFAAAYPETYHGVADLYVYFYQLGLRLLRARGRMGYIVTNKWMRAGYGEPLRAYFGEQRALERVVDFGHAPIFEDADVFPCILVLQKPAPADHLPLAGPAASDGEAPERPVLVTSVPREALRPDGMGRYVEEHQHAVPPGRFGRGAWTLETSAVDDLMEKLRRAGVPLREYAGVKPLYGIKTGLNEAFLVDTPTKDRLVREDPASAELIRPYLRGQDIRRWSPEWRGLWMLLLKSSGDHPWPWSAEGDRAEEVFQRTYPSLHAHLKPLEEKLRKRQDKGRFWWELRPCAYYQLFEQPKLIYQEIQTYAAFGHDADSRFANNKVFFLPTNDRYLLGVLNSPLIWWHNWRYLPHMINDTLTPLGVLMEQLPIAPPSDAIRAQVEPAVARLIELTRQDQGARADLLGWLRAEYGVESPGQRLEDFASLDADAFIEETRKRRPKTVGRLGPRDVAALRSGYAELATPARERRVSALVNAAYGLTPEEEALLWATAPPRTPRF